MPTSARKPQDPNLPPNYARVEGSERRPPSVARRTGPADDGEIGTISVYVRRRPDAPKVPDLADWAKPFGARPKHISREQLAATYGALPADLEKGAAFLRSHGFTIRETHTGPRVVTALRARRPDERGLFGRPGKIRVDSGDLPRPRGVRARARRTGWDRHERARARYPDRECPPTSPEPPFRQPCAGRHEPHDPAPGRQALQFPAGHRQRPDNRHHRVRRGLCRQCDDEGSD